MTRSEFLILLDRYRSGESTRAEIAKVERLIAADPARANELDWLRGLGAAVARMPVPEQWDVNALWHATRKALRAPQPGARREIALPPARRGWPLAVKVAAALVLMAAGGGLAVRGFRSTRAPAATGDTRVVSTQRGQQATLRLPDGTRVMLGVASALRYPAAFGRNGREVAVDGEAYFEVEHNDRQPLVVRAGDVVATDVGTAFSVRAYQEDGHAQVVVREGRVALRGAAPHRSGAHDGSVTLTAGQLGRLSQTGEPVMRAADTAAAFAWMQGWLVFDGTPLRDALPQLSRWYDLEFRLADSSLGRIPLAARLSNQPTPDALAFLAASLGLRHVRQGNLVTFYPAGARR